MEGKTHQRESEYSFNERRNDRREIRLTVYIHTNENTNAKCQAFFLHQGQIVEVISDAKTDVKTGATSENNVTIFYYENVCVWLYPILIS